MKKGGRDKQGSGFTIIEVLIVLAIAGLIMLIVFLAVPALQRNQRNAARRHEMERIGAAAIEFITNSNGSTPAAGNETAILDGVGNRQFTSGLVIASGNRSTAVAVDTPELVTAARCSGTDTAFSATAQNMAVRYTLEPGQSACLNI